MADDLDSFFDDVDQAETSVAVIEAETAAAAAAGASSNDRVDNGETTNVEAVEAEDQQPPTKKKKVEHVRPRGVVVAAASSVVSKQPTTSHPHDSEFLHQQQSLLGPPTALSNAAVGPYGVSQGIPPPPPPPAIPPPPPPAITDPSSLQNQTTSKKAHVRTAAGKTWTDATLADWPDNDFRLFVGNLDPTVTDALLYQHFNKYASLQRVRVIRDNKTGVSAGYGFVSLHNALECAAALREQEQSWLGGRPIRIKRSHWKDRELKEKRKKGKKR